jgi:hypothetical protein
MNIFYPSEHSYGIAFLGKIDNSLWSIPAEQWTENLVFAPRSTFAPSHGCEHERTLMTKNDRGTVNMMSTTRDAQQHAWPRTASIPS